MTPPAAPTAPPSDPEPVDRLGPRPIARARSGPERSPTSALSLRLRFADDREAEPGMELPEGQLTPVEGTRGTEAARHRLVLDAATRGGAVVDAARAGEADRRAGASLRHRRGAGVPVGMTSTLPRFINGVQANVTLG